MSSITKSIQNEYVLLMENAFSEKYKYAFRNLELKEGQKFFDIHESSRFNMSFKCSGEFNIIYIMRINIVEAQC